MCFNSLWCILRSGIAGSYGNSMVNLLQSWQKRFPQWLHHFIILPVTYEGSNSSTPFPTLVVIYLFDNSHHSGYKITLICLALVTTGEGNGNPLQCSCLENPRDGGAAQSRTRLKRLSSSSDYWCQISLHALIFHLHIFLKKCLFKFFFLIVFL